MALDQALAITEMSIASLINLPLYADLPIGTWVIFIFIGSAVGSFFNVLSLRWPLAQYHDNATQVKAWLSIYGLKSNCNLYIDPKAPPLLGGRSQCPACSAPIPLSKNIPLFSWIALKGKAACCGARISWRYLAYELFGAAVFAILMVALGPTAQALTYGLLIMVFSLIAVVDHKASFVPTSLIIAGFLLGYILTFSVGHWVDPLDAIKLAFAILISFSLIKYACEHYCRCTLAGEADVWITVLISTSLGLNGFLWCLVIGGGILAPFYKVLKNKTSSINNLGDMVSPSSIPYGPSMMTAASLVIIWHVFLI